MSLALPKESRDVRLEQLIEQRTCGRMHRIRVDRTEEGVVLHGKAPCYYVVQQAVSAVLSQIEARQPGERLELDVTVDSN